MLERKVCTEGNIKMYGSDDGPGTLEFYLSTFANWDRVRPIPERPTKDAFDKHLDKFMQDGFIAVGHDWSSVPIGTPKDASVDNIGLRILAELHSSQEAQNARLVIRERLERGKSVKTSMGYDVFDDEYVAIDDEQLKGEGIDTGRLLKEVYLYEGSIVNVPANPQADLLSVKSWLPDNLRLETHSEAVRATVKDYLARVSDLSELRSKEGRTISAATRRRLETILEAMDTLDASRATIAELLAIGEEAEKSLDINMQTEEARFYANRKTMRELGVFI